jgi:hypothetical protein
MHAPPLNGFNNGTKITIAGQQDYLVNMPRHFERAAASSTATLRFICADPPQAARDER